MWTIAGILAMFVLGAVGRYCIAAKEDWLNRSLGWQAPSLNADGEDIKPATAAAGSPQSLLTVAASSPTPPRG
jgi:hypothetical protein